MKTPMTLKALGLLLVLVHTVIAQINATNNGTTSQNATGVPYPSDPYLLYQPHFARSLPVQLLITGVVLTLNTTLLIQLCFTWQYHWPLARINWVLQFTGVCTLLLNIVAIFYVVLSALMEKSKEWPYMFEYVAIDIPRVNDWSIPEIAAWYVMEACTSALASITHIQFLTFLYPSRLEARLVFLLLGPLAIVSSIMTLLPISTYSSTPTSNTINGTLHMAPFNRTGTQQQQQLYDIIDAARNICNLTLSLLFTLSLLIWGFLVNRRSAWRTDGGTAAFGAGALFLALVSTGLNFLNVFESPRYVWLSPLLWSVVLWQSFLGWWWWVGSASGIAAREFDMEERGRKEQKRAKRRKRKPVSNEDESAAGKTARLDRWRTSMNATLLRRRVPPDASVSPSQSQTSTIHAETIELTTICSTPSTSGDSQPHAPRPPSSSDRVCSVASRAWRALRQAHLRAARVQAIEQRQIQIQMQLENGHGLGRFPGGPGGELDIGVLRGKDHPGDVSDGESSPPEDGQGTAPQRPTHDSGAVWWWGPLKKWRLRDSTTY